MGEGQFLRARLGSRWQVREGDSGNRWSLLPGSGQKTLMRMILIPEVIPRRRRRASADYSIKGCI